MRDELGVRHMPPPPPEIIIIRSETEQFTCIIDASRDYKIAWIGSA